MTPAASKALELAAFHGNLKIVKELADEGVNLNCQDQKGYTPLATAVMQGKSEVVKFLLGHDGVDVTLANEDEATPFFLACQTGFKDIVCLMMECQRVNVNQADEDGCTPFFAACDNGRADIVAELLKDPSVDVNKATSASSTPLWIAAQNGHLRVVKRILASGRWIDTTTKSTYNRTTPAERAEQAGKEINKYKGVKDDDPARRSQYCPLIVQALREYDESQGMRQTEQEEGSPGRGLRRTTSDLEDTADSALALASTSTPKKLRLDQGIPSGPAPLFIFSVFRRSSHFVLLFLFYHLGTQKTPSPTQAQKPIMQFKATLRRENQEGHKLGEMNTELEELEKSVKLSQEKVVKVLQTCGEQGKELAKNKEEIIRTFAELKAKLESRKAELMEKIDKHSEPAREEALKAKAVVNDCDGYTFTETGLEAERSNGVQAMMQYHQAVSFLTKFLPAS